MLRSTLLPFSCALLMGGCALYINSGHCESLNYGHRSLTLDAQQISLLKANTGAGTLEIVGVAGQQQILLEADVYETSASPATLTLQRHGANAVLVAEFPQQSFWGHSSPYIDLKLTVPATMALDITDGSGPLTISQVDANIKLTDGSGDITMVGGRDLTIVDGSGGIDIRDNHGNIQLQDGSGDVNLQRVAGNVTIEDGSGDLLLQQIQGVVTITDGSGGIKVYGAGGLVINHAGSGSLDYRDIKGEVVKPAK